MTPTFRKRFLIINGFNTLRKIKNIIAFNIEERRITKM